MILHSLLGFKETKVCGPVKFKCIYQAEQLFYTSANRKICNCLPSCTALSYDAYDSQTNYDFISAFSRSILKNNFNLEK